MTEGTFYPPFKSGWTYQGATYAGHSSYAVDWNRRTPEGGWLQDEGDPVLAQADGTVAEVDPSNGLVMINHFNATRRTESRHMKDIVVRAGDKVKRGDRIGSIGNVAGDGRSTAPHLHTVHYARDVGGWRRVQMRFLGEPIATSVKDSDQKPESWSPPPPVMVQGQPRSDTCEDRLDKAQTALAAQKAQTRLATEERDQARRELALAQDEVARLHGVVDKVRALVTL